MAYETEEEQVEALKRWWKENGKFVIVGLLVGAAAVFGWRSWETHLENRAVEASMRMAELQQAVEADEMDKARELAATLKQDYSATPYAAQAALKLAELELRAGELPAAGENLQWVVDQAEDKPVVLIARLRLAEVQAARGEHARALRTLGLAQPGAMAALYAERRGDIHLQMGDVEKARSAYQEALAALEEGKGDRALLEIKLNNLSAAPALAAE